MSKRTPRSVKDSCDKLFSKIIRSQGFCTRCGEKKYELLQPAHIYSRKFNSVRFDEDNTLCLCSGCHFWAHANPTEFTKWLETFINLDKLKEKKNQVVHYKLHNWLDLETKLKEKLNDIS